MDLGIAGKRAAVGGASAGLGYACAEALVAEGVRVAICSRDADRVEAAAARLRDVAKRHGQPEDGVATPIVCDISTDGAARSFIEQSEQALGGIDILIANGGGPSPGRATEVDNDAIRQTLEQCFTSLMTLCQAALPGMRERGWGRIVGITTIGVRHPLPNMVYSNTARTAFTAYLRMIASEAAGDGVTVNSLLPAAHATERITSLMGPAAIEAIQKNHPTGRMGDARDFGRIAAFLCSEWANYLSGVEIPVSGSAAGI